MNEDNFPRILCAAQEKKTENLFGNKTKQTKTHHILCFLFHFSSKYKNTSTALNLSATCCKPQIKKLRKPEGNKKKEKEKKTTNKLKFYQKKKKKNEENKNKLKKRKLIIPLSSWVTSVGEKEIPQNNGGETRTTKNATPKRELTHLRKELTTMCTEA